MRKLMALGVALAFSCALVPSVALAAELGEGAYCAQDLSAAFADEEPAAEGIGLQAVNCLVIDIEGECDQADAHNLLSLVNEARSRVGAPALTWDSRLEQTAMQRAAEIFMSFSHTRPDGSACFTAFPSSMLSSAGENIAAGYGSSSSVNAGWTNSPGHYANMVNAGFRSMAAACFAANGTKCWVEVFSGSPGDGAYAVPGVVWGTFPIRAYFEGLDVTTPANVIVERGDTRQLLASVRDQLSGEDAGTVNPATFDYASSNAQVVQVDANGMLRGVATGDAVITLRYKGTSTVAARTTVHVQPFAFSDVPADAWYVTGDVLGYAVDEGLFSGRADGSFAPDEPITRGQVAVVLHRMAGEPKVSAEPFEDVDYAQYYGDAISWARATGVVSGYADADGVSRRFGPEDSVTREQLAVMLANYAKVIGNKSVSSTCSRLDAMPDAQEASYWARTSVGWALDEGIISGSVTSGVAYANPQGVATRCQAAKMMSVLHRDVL